MRTVNQMKGEESIELFYLKIRTNIAYWSSNVMGYVVKPFHERWLNLAKKYKRVAIQAHTGSGKSEMMGIVYPLWYLFHNPNKEVLVVSKTLNQSIYILERIIEIVRDNELLRGMVDPKFLNSERWYSKSNSGAKICFSNGRTIRVAPLSDSIRGYHVDIVICDEVSSWTRKGDEELFESYVETRVNAKGGSLVAISTPRLPTDLMQQLINNEIYHDETFPVLNEKGESNWPEYTKLASGITVGFPMEKIDFIRKGMTTARFEREYLCNAKAEVENCLFKTEDVMSCLDVTLEYESQMIGDVCFMGCDFAISKGSKADFDAYWIIEKANGKAILRDIFYDKGVPVEEKVRTIKNWYDRYKPQQVLLDVSNIGNAVNSELIKLGLPLSEWSFKPSERKELLTCLVSFVQNGTLVIPHKKDQKDKYKISEKLIQEMLGFKEERSESTGAILYKSEAAHDDLVMSLALACKGVQDLNDCLVFPGGI